MSDPAVEALADARERIRSELEATRMRRDIHQQSVDRCNQHGRLLRDRLRRVEEALDLVSGEEYRIAE